MAVWMILYSPRELKGYDPTIVVVMDAFLKILQRMNVITHGPCQQHQLSMPTLPGRSPPILQFLNGDAPTIASDMDIS
jgi:hypothetical protein